MFERFVKDARQVVVDAQNEARALDAPAIAVEHLLLATIQRCPFVFLRDHTPTPYLPLHVDVSPQAERLRELLRRETDEALGAVGVSLREVERRAAATFGDDEWDAVVRSERLPFRNDAKRVLEGALRVALETRTRKITPSHILLALLRGGGRVHDLLRQVGLDPDDVAQRAEASVVSVRDLVSP